MICDFNHCLCLLNAANGAEADPKKDDGAGADAKSEDAKATRWGDRREELKGIFNLEKQHVYADIVWYCMIWYVHI